MKHGTGTYRVVNLGRYQHYKNRNPPWVKLYQDFLSDPDLARLSDGAKFMAAASILLASRYDNRIRLDGYWLWKQTGAQSPGKVLSYIRELVSIDFIDVSELAVHHASKALATCLQDASAERETETETEREKDSCSSASTTDPQPVAGSARSARPPASLRGFDQFWAVYPRKVGKGAAERAWAKIKPPPDLVTVIVASVQDHKLTEDWCKDAGQFIPYPATFLNQKRWEDALETEVARGTGPAPF